jgi:hypothetical protein
MAQELNINIALGTSQTGLTLKAQLVNDSGANVGSEVTSGFFEVGRGNYLWNYAAYPDDFTGGVKFINDADEVLMAFVALNAGDFGAGSGGSGDDPLESLVPGSYASGTAGAALGRIGVGRITVTNNVTPGGDVYLFVGDSYLETNGNALEFTDELGTAPDLTGLEVRFYVQSLDVEAEVVTPSGPEKKIRVELTAAQTATLEAIKTEYAIRIFYAEDEPVTISEGRAIVKTAP